MNYFKKVKQDEATRTGGDAAAAFRINRIEEFGSKEESPPLRFVSLTSQTKTPQFSTESKNGKKCENIAKPMVYVSKSQSTGEGIAVKRYRKERNWKVSSINEIPLDFPLERTRRDIYNVPVTEIVDRISKCLRLLSIDAKFDHENATAKCKTSSDMVSFHIRLFAGGIKKEDPIIVEMQRRSGERRCFMWICKKILGAAEGGEIQAETFPLRKMPLYVMKTPIGKMKCLQDVDKSDHYRDAHEGINKSLELLRSKEKDVNVLGLESFCFLTDPLRTRVDVAIICCEAIMKGQNCSEIRDAIGDMLQRDAFLPGEYEMQGRKDVDEKCRSLAIVLLSNVLALMSHNGCLDDAIQNQKWFTDFLIPSLSDEVKNFEISSSNAYEASCGLNHMATCSVIAKRMIKENFTIEDLQLANEFAMYNHELLASETKRSLEVLWKCV